MTVTEDDPIVARCSKHQDSAEVALSGECPLCEKNKEIRRLKELLVRWQMAFNAKVLQLIERGQ